MYYRMLNKAIYLLTEYEIFDYPISKDIIDQIIFENNLKHVVLSNISTACFIGDTILTPDMDNPEYRETLLHELGHANYHVGNALFKNKLILSKEEKQAQAFAAYFLLPIYVFEELLSFGYNDYELAEEFGVNVEFVKFRKELTEGLKHDGYFNNKEVKL